MLFSSPLRRSSSQPQLSGIHQIPTTASASLTVNPFSSLQLSSALQLLWQSAPLPASPVSSLFSKPPLPFLSIRFYPAGFVFLFTNKHKPLLSFLLLTPSLLSRCELVNMNANSSNPPVLRFSYSFWSCLLSFFSLSLSLPLSPLHFYPSACGLSVCLCGFQSHAIITKEYAGVCGFMAYRFCAGLKPTDVSY